MEEVKSGEDLPRSKRPINHHFRVRVGALVGRGFSIWFKNFVPATLLALVVSLPLVVLVYLFVPHEVDLASEETSLFEFLNFVIASFTGLVLSGALAYTTFQQLRGRKVAFGESLRIGLGRIFPVLGVSILAGVCIMLGLVACIIPGIILTSALYVAVPACVVEKPGMIEALKRSFDLTKNNRWPIFGAYFVQGLFTNLSGFVLGFALALAQPSALTFSLVITLVSVVLGSPGAVMQAVAYHDLRTGKEGAEIDELVAVFE